MASNIPDIGVRLTATGVQDIVNAFRKVQQEAKEAKTGGVDLLGKSLAGLTALLPAVSVAALGAGILKLALDARETAEAIGKLSQKTGASVGTLSALTLSAHDNEVSQEDLSKAMIKLAKNQEDASNGSAKQLKAFNDLGISLEDIKGKNPGEIFVLLSQRLAAMPNGAHKAQIAIELFGKAGALLIPMINDVGKAGGFEEAEAKAKKLGLYLTEDMVRDAQAAQDAIHSLEDIAAGLGTKLVAGFAGPFATAVEGVAKALEDLAGGEAGFEQWGNNVGHVILDVAAGFNTLWYSAVTAFNFVDKDLKKLDSFTSRISGAINPIPGASARAIMNAAADDAGIDAANNRQRGADRAYDKSQNDLAKASADLDHPKYKRRRAADTTDAGGGSGDGKDSKEAKDDADKLAVAKAAYLQARADNELAILKTKNTLEEAEDKRHYEAGTITLDQYYDNVEARIKASADAEQAALQSKLAAAANLPQTTGEQQFKRLQAMGKITAEMTELQLKETGDLEAAEDNRAKAKVEADQKELEAVKKLQTAAGDTAGAEQTNLQIELTQYDELLKKRSDLTDEQKKAALDSYTVKGQAKIGFGQNEQQLSGFQQGLGQDIQGLQDQAASGAITQVAAETKILEIEKQRLPLMQTLAEVMLQQAKDDPSDPTKLARAEAYIAALKHQADALKNVTTAQTELINQLSSQGPQALEEFFTAGISGSKSFEDALGDLSKTFENIVAKMISQLLVFYALKEVLGFVGVGTDTIDSIIGTSPFQKGFKPGGYTGGSSPDQIMGVVHGQEYVFDAPTTKANRALFDAIAAGGAEPLSIKPIAATASISSEYATSLAKEDAASPGAGNVQVQIVDGSGQKATTSRSTQSDGSQLIQVILGKVAESIKANGSVGQTLTATYGLQRQGVKRG